MRGTRGLIGFSLFNLLTCSRCFSTKSFSLLLNILYTSPHLSDDKWQCKEESAYFKLALAIFDLLYQGFSLRIQLSQFLFFDGFVHLEPLKPLDCLIDSRLCTCSPVDKKCSFTFGEIDLSLLRVDFSRPWGELLLLSLDLALKYHSFV